MATKFDITPEQHASFPRFLRQQISFIPIEVRDVNLQGKTAVVTGANTGVGLECSRQLLDLGVSKLILAVRNEDKGEVARANLAAGRNLPDDSIDVWKLDLCEYESVVSFAERTKSLESLDIVVLNAGIGPNSRIFNANTGHDEVIQVNYLSTVLLALLLLPVAKAKRMNQCQPSRITLVSSEVAAWTKFKEQTDIPLLSALDKQGKVDMMDRMMVSKLLGQIFLSELARRVPPSVSVINAVSPGSIHDSEFARDQEGTFGGAILKFFLRRVGNTSAVGARMLTDAAVNHGEETHGEFLSFQKMVPSAPIVYTPEGKRIAEQLWKETMAELSFADVENILSAVTEN